MKTKPQSNIVSIKKNTDIIQADPMLGLIDRVCSDPNFDITKMKALVDMRNAEIARLAEIQFNEAFSEMQPKLPRIAKLHTNAQTHSKYAKLEDINDKILPILSQYGFAVYFKTLNQNDDGITIQTILTHKGGHKESTDLLMPYDRAGAQGKVNKTDIHATGATISYARRYALCMILNISTGDDNDGNNKPLKVVDNTNFRTIEQKSIEYITEAQFIVLNELIDSSGVDKTRFIQEFLKVNSIKELPFSFYEKARYALLKRIEKNKIVEVSPLM